ncbi:MAG TPA: cytochrome c peroxidase [Chitinophagales bacterium]|nr:cytochrome c peroxidase [Chitinophagales bacterium]
MKCHFLTSAKFNTHFLTIFAAVLLLLFAAGCNPDEGWMTDDYLDYRLNEVLQNASGGVGKNHFILPESNNYAAIPQDPNNPITAPKVELGKLLFHETYIGLNPKKPEGLGTYSCASCHHVKAGFQACVPQGIGDGGIGFGINGEGRTNNNHYADSELDVQPIRTPSALNIAYQPNILWNGQFGATGVNMGTQYAWTPGTPKEKNLLGFEGAETQAIAGQDVHRLVVSESDLAAIQEYIQLFNAAFPDVPPTQRVSKVNAGLAIAAYERTLLANQAPFQQWLRGNLNVLTEHQKRGAILFFSKANCYKCHNSPALNDMNFYALGMNDLNQGSYGNVFNATPNKPEHKGRGGFTNRAEDMYKFKTPQLYNLKNSPFYGHGASFNTVRQVVEYKNNAVPQNHLVPANMLSPEFKKLYLSEQEIDQITDFIENALNDPNLARYVPQSLPSGNCFPNNDQPSKHDLGCE